MLCFLARTWLSFALCCIALPVAAGAWLHPQGDGFISIGATQRWDRQFLDPTLTSQEYSLYATYGLLPKMTAGLDINLTDGSYRHALLFLRFPVSPASRISRALELGIGRMQTGSGEENLARITASFGNGFDGRWAGARDGGLWMQQQSFRGLRQSRFGNWTVQWA